MTTVKKSPAVGETQTVQVNTAVPVVPTEADKIWAEIRNKPLALFALAGKTVAHFCTPTPIEPTKLFLTSTASAVLPELEATIGPDYVCEKQDRFIIVSRTPKLPGQK